MNNPIIVTWGAWYVWAHVVVSFMQSWYDVVILDDFSNSEESTITKISKIVWRFPDYYNVNLKNIDDIEKVFNYYDTVDGVVHLAWCAYASESCEKSFDYYDINVLWSINLFKVMKRFQVNKLIYSSSWFVYDPEKWNFANSELDDIKPYSPYATTKLIVENIIENMSKFHGINALSLRTFNPIWAHQSGLIWEDVFGMTHTLLYNILDNVINANGKLKIYWSDYNTPDGTAIRDFIDVMDLADWYLKSYKFLEQYIVDNKDHIQEWVNWVLNIWSWKWYSIRDIISKVEWLSTKKVNYEISPKRIWDVPANIADISRIKEFLSWTPTISIEQSIKNLWNFIDLNKKD